MASESPGIMWWGDIRMERGYASSLERASL
jgi:hypothetical protein